MERRTIKLSIYQDFKRDERVMLKLKRLMCFFRLDSETSTSLLPRNKEQGTEICMMSQQGFINMKCGSDVYFTFDIIDKLVEGEYL